MPKSSQPPHLKDRRFAQCYRMQARKQSPAGPRRKAATTEDVLGAPDTRHRVPPKWKRHYASLEQLRERLLNKKNDLANDARQEITPFSMHMADAGTDVYDRDWALSMISSEQDAVYQIEQAMDRIHNNTYGICELSGKPIEPERLAAIPWTRFSAASERELEKNGLAEKAKLGALGSLVSSLSPESEDEDTQA